MIISLRPLRLKRITITKNTPKLRNYLTYRLYIYKFFNNFLHNLEVLC